MKDAIKILLIGRGYFYIRSANEDVVKNLLLELLLKAKWDRVVVQTWVEGFNPNELEGLIVPMW